MNRALLQQALYALENSYPTPVYQESTSSRFKRSRKAIAALKAELEKPEPEPVAWVFVPHNELLWPDEVEHKTPCEATGYIPLYATPRKEST